MQEKKYCFFCGCTTEYNSYIDIGSNRFFHCHSRECVKELEIEEDRYNNYRYPEEQENHWDDTGGY